MTSPAKTRDDATDSKTAHWLRILPLIFFGIIAWLMLIASYFMAAVQFIVVIVTDEPNAQLRDFAARIGSFVHELIDYLLYRTDQMPFPFAPFPDGESAPTPKQPRAKPASRPKATKTAKPAKAPKAAKEAEIDEENKETS
ncbi:MAG: DUF4389 domain-containing protein [Sphingomonadales bacterium]